MNRYRVEIEFDRKDIVLASRVLMYYGYDTNMYLNAHSPSYIVVFFGKMTELDWKKAYRELEELVMRYNFISILALVD